MFVKDNTIASVKAYMKNRLANQFSDSEIRMIISYALDKRLQLNHNQQVGIDQKTVSESDLLFFRSVVKRLQANEPLAYIIGFTEFDDLNILCDKRALIPRPETVELVMLVASYLKNIPNPSVFDLCAGTGCVGLALENRFKSAKIISADISEEALTLIWENKKNLKSTIEILQFDALNPSHYQRFNDYAFDAIVCNPPYIPNSQKNEMHENVLSHEPHIALFVENENPLIFYQAVAENGMKILKNKGILAFELNEFYAIESKQLLESLDYIHVQIHQDLQGKKRMLTAIKK